ncbi:MAG: cobalamin-dependent protein, partial [Deltaproteobacteria bacterium]|nr:cobalamin-dependent protein [Deltaproteobacteria bacterium]
MKRILLLRPDFQLTVVRKLRAFLHLEPLALEYLAGSIPEGNEVKILDLTAVKRPINTLKKMIKKFRPDMVGVTAYSNQIERAAGCIKIIHEECPDSIIVLGGHHATIIPDECRIPHLDAIVRGEGCGPFREIIEAMDSGEKSIFSIPNVYPSDADDFGPIPLYPGVDSLPKPRRDLVD